MKNFKFKFLILLGVLTIGLTSCSKEANTTAPEPDKSDGTKEVDNKVNRYMSQNSVPGVTLAVAKNGKLVYAKAYGFADEDNAERMTTKTRSRISSVSKTVTAIAIMKLIEDGKLDLNDKIFGDNGVLENDFGNVRPYRQYITDLTIKHCLSHHVGGWANNNDDPTMKQNNKNASELISWIIDNVPLAQKPGENYAYSNVGFMILGRVIEKVSGKTYEKFVQDEILQPIGIDNMEIGGNTLDDRKENESRYHDSGAYTRNFSRRDANGGWIASPSDMVKLFVHIDGFSTVPDILQPGTLQRMTTSPFDYKNYGLGVYLDGSTWYHGGSFSGSRSHWIRTGSGYVAMIMINSSASDLKTLLEDILSSSIDWPDQDLFN